MDLRRLLRFKCLIFSLFCSACNQGGKEVHVNKHVGVAADAHGTVDCTPQAGTASGTGSMTMSGMGLHGDEPETPCTAPTGAPSMAGLTDVVVIVATSASAASLATKIPSGIASLAKALALGSGSGLKLAVITKAAAALTSATGLPSGSVKGIDFSLTPGLALIGVLAAGCKKDVTTFPASVTAAAGPRLCGEALLSIETNKAEDLQSASLSVLNPVRDTLSGFLRAGVARAYIVISDGDAQYMNGEVLTKIVKAQNGGRAAPLFALVPTTDGASGDCAAETKASDTYKDVTGDTKGALFSYCDKSWTASVNAIAAAIAKLK